MKRNGRLEFDDLAKSSFQSLYAPVEINNIKLEMIIDTGSPVTLIAENIIESLGVDLSRVESTLYTADGNTMSVKSQIKVNIKIDKTEFKQDAIVTKLGKLKGIIGMDFLQNLKCQLKLSEVKLVIGQQSFNLRKHYNTNVVALSRIPVRKCKRELCRECYPNSDPYFQGQTEENVECRVCDQTHPGYCPAVMAKENELLETIINTDTETSQGQSSESNWFDFWSKQEIKIIQENEPAIGEMTMP
jgi:hypothetical protein